MDHTEKGDGGKIPKEYSIEKKTSSSNEIAKKPSSQKDISKVMKEENRKCSKDIRGSDSNAIVNNLGSEDRSNQTFQEESVGIEEKCSLTCCIKEKSNGYNPKRVKLRGESKKNFEEISVEDQILPPELEHTEDRMQSIIGCDDEEEDEGMWKEQGTEEKGEVLKQCSLVENRNQQISNDSELNHQSAAEIPNEIVVEDSVKKEVKNEMDSDKMNAEKIVESEDIDKNRETKMAKKVTRIDSIDLNKKKTRRNNQNINETSSEDENPKKIEDIESSPSSPLIPQSKIEIQSSKIDREPNIDLRHPKRNENIDNNLEEYIKKIVIEEIGKKEAKKEAVKTRLDEMTESLEIKEDAKMIPSTNSKEGIETKKSKKVIRNMAENEESIEIDNPEKIENLDLPKEPFTFSLRIPSSKNSTHSVDTTDLQKGPKSFTVQNPKLAKRTIYSKSGEVIKENEGEVDSRNWNPKISKSRMLKKVTFEESPLDCQEFQELKKSKDNLINIDRQVENEDFIAINEEPNQNEFIKKQKNQQSYKQISKGEEELANPYVQEEINQIQSDETTMNNFEVQTEDVTEYIDLFLSYMSNRR